MLLKDHRAKINLKLYAVTWNYSIMPKLSNDSTYDKYVTNRAFNGRNVSHDQILRLALWFSFLTEISCSMESNRKFSESLIIYGKSKKNKSINVYKKSNKKKICFRNSTNALMQCIDHKITGEYNMIINHTAKSR